MLADSNLASASGVRTTTRLYRVLAELPKDGPERQAIAAGEIDAVIDYAHTNVILFPTARRALRDVANPGAAANPKTARDSLLANSLLASLPDPEYQRLLPGLEPVTLRVGEVLHEPGTPIRYVYFPVDCVVCLLAKTDSRRLVEVGLFGYDGIVGISLALGVDVPSARAVVMAPGTALRMAAARFCSVLRQCPQLRNELYRYTYVKMAQARQTARCIGSHLFEARLACCLLMTSDRVRSNEISLTHEFLATIFGVRRVTVTKASVALRERNLISYGRGKIRILDRKGLEATSCSCYSNIEAQD